MSSHLALKDGVRDADLPHALLPLYNWIVLGMSEEGKTSLMASLFIVEKPSKIILDVYDKCYFVNPKAHPDALQSPYDMLDQRNSHNQFVFLPSLGPREWDGIKERAKQTTKMSLMVLDDMTGDRDLMQYIGGTTNGKGAPGIITHASHNPPAGFRLHIWTFAHSWKVTIPKGIRSQAKALACTKVKCRASKRAACGLGHSRVRRASRVEAHSAFAARVFCVCRGPSTSLRTTSSKTTGLRSSGSRASPTQT
jgi:hypothetical protein